MGGELKSTFDLVMEKYGDAKDSPALSDDKKQEIGEIRKSYEAKIAEVHILLKGDENLPREVARLRRQMEEKIHRVRERKASS
jgi:hypothetical protein